MSKCNLINYQVHIMVQTVVDGAVPGAENSEQYLKNANEGEPSESLDNRHLFLSEDNTEVYHIGIVDYLQTPEIISKAKKVLQIFKKNKQS